MSTSARLNLMLLVALFGCAAAFIAWWVAVWFMRGSYLTAAIAFGIALYSAGFAFQMAYVLWGAPTPRMKCGAEGTVIRTQKSVGLVFVVGFAAGVSAAALYLAFSPFGFVDYTPTGVLRVAVPAFCGFLIVFGVPTLYRAFKYGAESHLRLDQNGFEVWNGHWGSLVRRNWTDIDQILDHPLRGRGIRREVIVFVLPKGRSAMLMADAITGNTAALRDWVQFYWQHPEFRDELVDGRGLQRLDEGSFTVE